MRSLAIVYVALATMSCVQTVPIYAPCEKPPFTRTLSANSQVSNAYSVVRDGDDRDQRDDDENDIEQFSWVTSLPPLDAVWQQEIANGQGDSIWGNASLAVDDDVLDYDYKAEPPLSTLIPLPALDESKGTISETEEKQANPTSVPNPRNIPLYDPPPQPSPDVVLPSESPLKIESRKSLPVNHAEATSPEPSVMQLLTVSGTAIDSSASPELKHLLYLKPSSESAAATVPTVLVESSNMLQNPCQEYSGWFDLHTLPDTVLSG